MGLGKVKAEAQWIMINMRQFPSASEDLYIR